MSSNKFRLSHVSGDIVDVSKVYDHAYENVEVKLGVETNWDGTKFLTKVSKKKKMSNSELGSFQNLFLTVKVGSHIDSR